MNTNLSCAATVPAPVAPGRANRTAIALLVVITTLLLALGVTGWWFLAGIDSRYSHVLAETAASLGELHEVGVHAFTGYGNLMELRQIRDPNVRAARLQTIMGERAANDALYAKLDRELTNPELRACLQDVIANRMLCRQQGNALMAEVPDTTSTVASTDKSVEFLRSCIAYQQSCNRLTDRIETASLKTSRELAGDVRSLRWLFLGVGVLPVAGALIFLAVTLGLLQVVKIDGEEEF